MRVLLPLALILLAGGAAAQAEGKDAFTLVGHYDGRSYFWTLLDGEERNPTLVVPANATVTVTIRNEGSQVHNLQVEGQAASAYVDSDHPEQTYTFQAPASGTLGYWCQPHKASGMRGTVAVAGSVVTPSETPALPWAAAAGVLVALALLRR